MTQKMKILVVDDSQVVRKIIRKELEAGGYIVDEAEDGFEAIVYSTMVSPPDLITLDIEMPGLNGFETCKKLQEKRYAKNPRRPPVIFVTGKDTLEDRKIGFKLGAADFITKPFEDGDILAAVNKILIPENRLHGMTALVADDNATARIIICDILKREGLTVIEAPDGMYAYETMCNRMADIDLVISDFVMPRLTGEELCIKIRKELELIDIPIIVITAMSEHSELLRLFKAGATDYLLKPFVKEELLARLSVHLERTHLNKQLRDSINKLTGLNKMKDDILAVCSHDLRTPLNGIIGFTELMLDKDYLQSEDREHLGHIKESGNFLMSLINDILDLSKIQSEKSPLPMAPMLAVTLTQNCIIALTPHAAQKNIQITFQDHSVKGVINCNKNALKRVINNLLSNAIKFTPDGGKIDVTIATKDTSKELSISVKDSGIGIPEDQIPYLFDKYTKTSQSGTKGEKGTGLGMSIVKEMVDRHGGRIEVTSEVNKGSCFKIIFPQSDQSEQFVGDNRFQDCQKITAPQDCEKNQQAIAMKEKFFNNENWKKVTRFLMAEDNFVNQELTRSIFAKHNMHLDLVENGIEAVEAVKNNQYHAVFMDMQMPELNGIDATKKIRQELKLDDIPIIAMTANTGEFQEQCRDAGMNGFITKPAKMDIIINELKQHMNIEQIVSALKEIENDCSDDLLKTDSTNKNEQQDIDSKDIFDKASAVELLDGDTLLFDQILVLFLQDTPDLISKLENAFKNNDFTNLEMYAHTLKSTSATICANKLSTVSKEMEHAAHEKDWEKARSFMKHIVSVYNELKNVLDKQDERC
ncbi:MAG: histidine kinase [Candidatus Magnetoglobus multicellularis str. Araruama]|uniref:histidine kinase n=1 Tax=Candidatus Magnetoglobus multicellularis str. Araruama TaxID=890399 RepID=A0A1V1PCX7_9BACT|nr:MAG: histidine kinase [Candidatus Magnetoglobus multicellularis str. Araruama]